MRNLSFLCFLMLNYFIFNLQSDPLYSKPTNAKCMLAPKNNIEEIPIIEEPSKEKKFAEVEKVHVPEEGPESEDTVFDSIFNNYDQIWFESIFL